MSPSSSSSLAGAGLLAVAIAAPAAAGDIRFEDVTASAGVRFQHLSGASERKFLPETMAAGVCLLDADGDGRLDLFLVNGGPSTETGFEPGPGSQLYRNLGGMRFEEATGRSGLVDRGYGMGCTAGDIDNDGDSDLYVTHWDGNRLWLNDGKGRFREAPQAGGAACGYWSVSAAFGDLDQDGWLDLYAANYVDWSPKNNKYCGDLSRNLRSYCHPDVFDGQPPCLLRNDGKGRFVDVTREAGIFKTNGKGLGVILSDLDGDGRTDIYGANDSTINYLFLNQTGPGGKGGLKLKDVSLLSGAGFDANGRAQAGMGVDSGDVDGDGDLDIFVTNLDLETNTLYVNQGQARFRDQTIDAGLALPGLLNVGFGAAFADFDQDGDLDLAIANGHIIDNIEKFKDNMTYAQPTQVFANDGKGRFADVSAGAGAFFGRKIVGRGLATGDLDGDGDPDLVLTTCGGPAYLLENRSGAGGALLVRLVGTVSNRDGLGARVTVTAGGRELMREAKSASSYASQGDPRLHFGLGPAAAAERIEVRWPSGKVDRLSDVAAGAVVTIQEGKGLVARAPFRTGR